MKPVTRKQIDSILPFLDRFDAADFSAGSWSGEPRKMPWFDFDNAVDEFRQTLAKKGWGASDFDWTEWKDTAQKYVDSPEMIDSADAETIRKLFTTHVRADRFSEGHLASVLENGHILSLLRRLKVLREELIRERGKG